MRARTCPWMMTLALVIGLPRSGAAQSATVASEVDVTAGYSTEQSARAAAVQLRVFGETTSRIRFHVEGTWADRSDVQTDVFGAAYPYGGRLQLSEAYAERTLQHDDWLTEVRVGRYRSPFGISHRSDYAYSGLSRAPLMRYDGYWAVTNNFLEQGVDILTGVPHLSLEASLGTPGDIGVAQRRAGVSGVLRLQANAGDLTMGASHMTSRTYDEDAIGTTRLAFSSVDGRWMRAGVQVRGEWLIGHYDADSSTRGWFVDTAVHRHAMGPVTAVFRVERLRFSSEHAFHWLDELHVDPWLGVRHSAGARIRLPGGLTAQAAVVRHGAELAEYGTRTALDLGVTYSIGH